MQKSKANFYSCSHFLMCCRYHLMYGNIIIVCSLTWRRNGTYTSVQRCIIPGSAVSHTYTPVRGRFCFLSHKGAIVSRRSFSLGNGKGCQSRTLYFRKSPSRPDCSKITQFGIGKTFPSWKNRALYYIPGIYRCVSTWKNVQKNKKKYFTLIAVRWKISSPLVFESRV